MPDKKTLPAKAAKKTTAKKEKQKAIGFMNPVMTLNDENKTEMKLKGIAIFNDGKYVDKNAVHLVEVAKRNGGEITVPMMVTFRPMKETVLPDDTDIPLMQE